MNTNSKNRRSSRKVPPTSRQLECREKMSVAVHFLNPLHELTDLAYQVPRAAKRPSGYQGALGYLIEYAVTGSYPGQIIDFSRVILSKGRLVKAAAAGLSADGGQLLITWEYAEGRFSWLDDEVVVVLYSQESDMFLVSRHVAKRRDGFVRISLSEEFAGCTIHGYLLFLSRNGKDSSQSVYIGSVSPVDGNPAAAIPGTPAP